MRVNASKCGRSCALLVRWVRPMPYHHAPMRRILWDLRVWTEGMRALGYWCGHVIDLAAQAPDAGERTRAGALAALLTPVVKSFFTERGFQLASDALQVFGGYGYVHEYRIEQILRDSRIAMIYEGTNQIQALDLLQRKVLSGPDGLAPLLEVFAAEAALPSAHAASLQKLVRHAGPSHPCLGPGRCPRCRTARPCCGGLPAAGRHRGPGLHTVPCCPCGPGARSRPPRSRPEARRCSLLFRLRAARCRALVAFGTGRTPPHAGVNVCLRSWRGIFY